MQATSNINFKPLSKAEQLVFNKFEYNINKKNKGIIQKIKNLMNSLKIRLFIGSKQCERKMNEFNNKFHCISNFQINRALPIENNFTYIQRSISKNTGGGRKSI